MSLLRRGLEAITLYPRVYRADGDGNSVWTPWRAGDPTVTVQARVSPLTGGDTPLSAAGETASSADRADSFTTVFHVAAPSLPVGAVALGGCRIDWSGRTFDLYQYPHEWQHGRRTRHWTFSMVERTG